MTSSPFFILKDNKERCNAVVQLDVDSEFLHPENLLNKSSKFETYFPLDEIQPFLIQSFKYNSSFPIRLGSY